MKFIVDCMLGKLAKWLKILGFDTAYDPAADDDRLLLVARKEERTLLSRDTGLLARAKGLASLHIESESWPDQVRQVLAAFDLRDKTAPYTRCLGCNVKLKPLSRDKARNLVSPFILERAKELALCPSCGRVFWQGTHFEAMEARLADLLQGAETGKASHRGRAGRGKDD
jgi:uncharacterized protein with PIN domain